MPNTSTYTDPTDPVLLLKGKLIQKEISCEILLKAYSRQQAFSDTFQAIVISLKKALWKPTWLNHITQGNTCIPILISNTKPGKKKSLLLTYCGGNYVVASLKIDLR